MPDKLVSTAAAAELLGCDKSTITRHAARLGLGLRIGTSLGFGPGDLVRLRAAVRPGPGNPTFGGSAPSRRGKSSRRRAAKT